MDNSELDVISTVEDNKSNINFRSTFAKSKWSKKSEYVLVKYVRKRLKDMDFGRRTSCFWASPPSEGGNSDFIAGGQEVTGVGSDWAQRWNLDAKLWLQWHQYLDDGRSNLKSPMSLAAVEAFMAEFYKSPGGVVLSETTDDDKITVQKLKDYINYLESKEFDRVKKESARGCATYGTDIIYSGYVIDESEKECLLTDAEIDQETSTEDEDKRTKIKKTLTEDKKPLTKKVKIVHYNDCAIRSVNIFNFYIDENAECIEGLQKRAMDCIERETPSLEQFRAMFKNSKDPFIIKENIDKVKSAYAAYSGYSGMSGQRPFFEIPKDIATSSTRIELLNYYNRNTDKYIIIANDVVIRDGPLPYNHGKLPYSISRFMKFKNQFYGIGIPVLLESLQGEDETLRNLAITTLKKLINPAVFINSLVFGQVDSQWDRVEAGMKIEVDGDPNTSIAWDRGPANIHFGEIMNMRKDLHDDAILAVGINSMAESMPQANQAVRNNLLSQASTQLMISKAMEEWNMGYVDAINMIIPVAQQMLPLSYEIIKGDSENPELDDEKLPTTKKYKTIRVTGHKYNDNITGTEIEKIEGSSDVELNPKAIKTKGPVTVMIDTDRLTPMSQSFRVQNVQNAIQFLAPILSNPNMMQAPGMTELIHDYVDWNGLSKHIYDDIQQADTTEDITLAKEQEMKLAKGLIVPGVPGESDVHKNIHMQEMIVDVSNMSDPTTPPEVKMHLQMVIANRAEHLQIDETSKETGVQTALQMAQPPQQPMMPPQGGMGGQQPGMPMPQQMGGQVPQQAIGQSQPGNPQMGQIMPMQQI